MNNRQNNRPEQQVDDAGCKTFSVKVPAWVHELIDIIADSLQRGTNGNDLVKKCLMFLIETAKVDGPVPPEFQTLLNMLKLDPSWHTAFNFADSAATTDIAQMVLILQQHDPQGKPRRGFGLTMIDKPFMGASHMTTCVDDILERVCEVSMPGLYRQVRQVGIALESQSLRETLTLLCDAQTIAQLDEDFRAQLPGMGTHTDYGQPYEYGQRKKVHQHRTPDGEAYRQQRIRFDDDDSEQAEQEVTRDLNAELSTGHALDDDLESEMGFKPFDQEW